MDKECPTMVWEVSQMKCLTIQPMEFEDLFDISSDIGVSQVFDMFSQFSKWNVGISLFCLPNAPSKTIHKAISGPYVGAGGHSFCVYDAMSHTYL